MCIIELDFKSSAEIYQEPTKAEKINRRSNEILTDNREVDPSILALILP